MNRVFALDERPLVDGKSAGVQRLALAAPVVGGSGPMVAYVELPLEKLASGVEAPTVPSDTYLAA